MHYAGYPDDIPDQVFVNLLRSWYKVSRFRESGSIYVYHKGIVLRRHQALLNRPDLIKSIFNNQVPVLIDLELSDYQDFDYLEQEFLRHETNRAKPIYWICGLDQLLIGKSDTFFHFLRKRQAEDPAISYILFFSVDFLHPSISQILTYTSTFLQNSTVTPLFDEEVGRYFLQRLMFMWKFTIPEKIQIEILNQTAKHFLTLKQAARFIRDTKSYVTENIMRHEMMNIKLKSIYDGLLPSEQTALGKIVLGANDFTSDEAASIKFLKKTGWLISSNHKLLLTIPLFARYVEILRYPQKLLSVNEGRILLGDVPVNLFFSDQEQIILKLLVSNKGKSVSREQLARAIWLDQWSEKYSDWAIDQIVSRIRKKCCSLDLRKSIIETIKGKGFRYAEH